MPHYRQVGDVPAKRHVAHHGADGALRFEELMGQDGFASNSALLYHLRSPSAIVACDAVDDEAAMLSPDHPLLPRHLRTAEITRGGDAVTGRTVVLGNDDLRLAWIVATETSSLYRNAVGDELIYVQEGSAWLESVFGRLEVRAGDYVVIPACTTHRWVVHEPFAALLVETTGHVRPPARYRAQQGQFLETAPYCERDVRAPDAPLLTEGANVPVLVRTRAGMTRMVHATHPFDVTGWDGCLYPWAMSIHDFEPIVGRVHQPPPVHQTFEGPGFVVCSFVPRLYDFHPDAIKVPYHHANTDSDEVLFYSGGNFMSRTGSGIGVGSISFHPAGFVHGPQPGSIEASLERDRTDELAVMIDTFRPLGLTDAARRIAAPDYPWTWAGITAPR